jgi:hypothetical protein
MQIRNVSPRRPNWRWAIRLSIFAVQVAESAEKAAGVRINEAFIPPKQKRLLLMYARAMRTAAGSPLSLAEIDRQIRLRVM